MSLKETPLSVFQTGAILYVNTLNPLLLYSQLVILYFKQTQRFCIHDACVFQNLIYVGDPIKAQLRQAGMWHMISSKSDFMAGILPKSGLNSAKARIAESKRYLEVNIRRTIFKTERQKLMLKDLRLWPTSSRKVSGVQDTEYLLLGTEIPLRDSEGICGFSSTKPFRLISHSNLT